MKKTADYLKETVHKMMPLLNELSEAETSIKPLPTKWSKKEILGHLVDSACNNQQKFIRTMTQEHLDFMGYAQDFWVNAQNYNAYEWKELVLLWKIYNLHIAHIIENVHTEVLQHTISIEGIAPFTLEFIMKDYVEHQLHHLKAILPNAGLQSKFMNVYGA
jgi:hypothetical protein